MTPRPLAPAVDTIATDAAVLAGELIALRHELHRHPEVGLVTPETQRIIVRELDPLNLEVAAGDSLTSVVAVLRGGRPGPAVLLRADIDALEVGELTDEPFASEIDGRMHACGNDLHCAGLVGAARLLAARRDELAGSVVFMFEPGAEVGDGARIMLDEGVLNATGDRVSAAFAVHTMASSIPSGLAVTRPGVMLAGLDECEVVLHGRGGHAAQPHLAADPVPVAAELVLALHHMADRGFDPFDPVLISVSELAAGIGGSTIPETARVLASMRTYSRQTQAVVQERVIQLCRGIAAAHGIHAEIAYTSRYPVTINSPAETDLAADVARHLFGTHQLSISQSPVTGADDFAHVLDQVPGAYVVLGAMPPDADPLLAGFNHSPTARFDDAVVPRCAELLAALAAQYLHEASEQD